MSTELLMKAEPEKKLALLKAVKTSPRLDRLTILPPITDPSTDPILLSILNRPSALSEPMALDFETMGLPFSPSSCVVGVGLADSRGSWYIDFQASHPDTYRFIIHELRRLSIPLIAHNMNFDALWPMRDWNIWLNWKACTYACYKLTATEGWPGQKWGLKDAQTELLGWESSNEGELDQWLVDNGYGESVTDGKTGAIKLRPAKAEMWRAPPQILGKYCALDADSTFQLWQLVLEPVIKQFKALNIYSTVWYPKYQRILIEQSLSGIRINRPQLEDYRKVNEQDINKARRAIFNSPLLRKHLDRFNIQAIKELKEVEPAQFLKERALPKEPPQYKKDGKISKNWLKWTEQRAQPIARVTSANWIKWHEKYKRAISVEHFNFNSYPQKKELFYEMLYPTSHPTVIERRQGDRTIREDAFKLVTPEREVLLPLTKSGGTPVDRKALRQMGAIGQLFLDYNDLQKEQQFIDALLQNSQTGRLHPQFRVPGTLTGRLSGGGGKYKMADGTISKGFNIQQIPKSPGFLRNFIPDEGWTFVDCDHSALEQVVLAELSQDKALLKLYGPDANPYQDVYLTNGAALPGIGKAIRDAGYDPDNATAESTAKAKSICKKERAIAKIVTLGASYKMGPAKLQRTLDLEGVKVSFEEAREIHRGYWTLYAGVKDFERHLMQQYEDNEGWILNGIGRPIGIFESYKSDIVNRTAQSTGHDCHILYVITLEQVLRDGGIPYRWVIADFHDQSIIQVPLQYADKARALMGGETYTRLNSTLKGKIPLRGDAQVVRDLSYAKCAREDVMKYLKDIGIVEEQEED